MTALSEYDRLEATGLWRANPDDQRREVILSLGDATLIISDKAEQPLGHWSIAAIERANPGQMPALYYPEGDETETLELAQSDMHMVEAIERLRSAVARRRHKPGRLRLIGSLISVAVVAGIALFWVPPALINHTVSVAPTVYRQSIGTALLSRITRVSGEACNDPSGEASLKTLGARLGGANLVVLPAGVSDSLRLPGGITVLNRALVEDFEGPEVAAGYIIAEQTRARSNDPLRDLLEESGAMASFRLLTTGKLDDETLDDYAVAVLTKTKPDVVESEMLASFDAARVPSTPYARAVDITGESTATLIESDPMADQQIVPIMEDADWVRLQGICGG